MSVTVHISLGPVQAFVAQARRTRDLWAGSYLLSYLSGRAMVAALEGGGRLQPKLLGEDPMVEWLRGRRSEPPRIGSLPNHFAVTLRSAEQAGGLALRCEDAVRTSWQQICEAVWKQFLERIQRLGNKTRTIWDRQTAGFWEILWVAGGENEAGLLDRRKRWRTHWLPEEPGDKCSLMPDFQELSGWLRANPGTRRKQDDFWRAVRDRVGELEIRQNERLCAIALVKRLFGRVSDTAIGASLDVARWPSTVYIATVPWFRTVTEKCPDEGCAFADHIKQAAPREALAEFDRPFDFSGKQAAGLFTKIDGYYLHRASLGNEEVTPLRDETERQALLKRLKELQERTGAGPAAYYALVLADGDCVGALATALKQQFGESGLDTLSGALARFSHAVREGEFCRRHDVTLIYAGGDDLLALSPLPTAFEFVRALREHYRSAFRHLETRIPAVSNQATISAAVVFAHIHAPLVRVLENARESLENVAKRANGRDSVVVTVYRHGGCGLQWVTTWQRRLDANGSGEFSSLQLHDELVELLTGERETALSMSLMSRLHETLVELSGAERWQPGQWLRIPLELDLTAFLKAEILASLSKRGGENWQAAARRAEQYAERLARLLPRAAGDGSQPTKVSGDALLLARFLATGGSEEEHA